MSIQEQLFTSFIKGVAKTTGSLTVLSLVAILWNLYTNETGDDRSTLPTNVGDDRGTNEISEDIKANDRQGTDDFSIDYDQSTVTLPMANPSVRQGNFKRIFDQIQ